MRIYQFVVFLGLLLSIGCVTTHPLQKSDLLAYQQDFNSEDAIQEFEFTDPSVWRMNSDGNGSMALECFERAKYEPEVRSPFAIGLISDRQFGSFILEADLQQTGRIYGHQDMVIVFGFQDPSHFYYTHIAREMDDHANNIFIVNGAPRTKISTKTNQGQDWKAWHKIKVERSLSTGYIAVYFDDMKEPVMEASDQNFGSGSIGFGTFDDSGKIDNIKIWTDQFDQKEQRFFTKD